MLLSEVTDALLVRTGQHVIGDIMTVLNLDYKRLWNSIKYDIADYQKYVPLTKHINVNSFSDSYYDFTLDTNNAGYVSPSEPGAPPKFLSKVTPLNSSLMPFVGSPYVAFQAMLPDQWGPNRLVNPRPFLWNYQSPPKMMLSEYGCFDITAHYDYPVVITYEDDESTYADVEVVGLNEDKVLLRILTGRFLQLLGRSRRSFTYEDIPIKTDADDLVKEGIDEYEAGMKDLLERNDAWFLSVMP